MWVANLFFDKNGDFIWTSIAAIASLIAAFISIFSIFLSMRTQKNIAKRKIVADVISKSRMHWIDSTKDIVSDFLIDALTAIELQTMFVETCYELVRLKDAEYENELKIKNDNTDIEKKELIDLDKKFKKMIADEIENTIQLSQKINSLIYNSTKNHALLLLNFSSNYDNNQITDLVRQINDELMNTSIDVKILQRQIYNERLDWNKTIESIHSKKRLINEKVENLTNILREYYKKEWEKVKSGN